MGLFRLGHITDQSGGPTEIWNCILKVVILSWKKNYLIGFATVQTLNLYWLKFGRQYVHVLTSSTSIGNLAESLTKLQYVTRSPSFRTLLGVSELYATTLTTGQLHPRSNNITSRLLILGGGGGSLVTDLKRRILVILRWHFNQPLLSLFSGTCASLMFIISVRPWPQLVSQRELGKSHGRWMYVALMTYRRNIMTRAICCEEEGIRTPPSQKGEAPIGCACVTATVCVLRTKPLFLVRKWQREKKALEYRD